MFKPSAGFGAFGGGAGSFTSNAFSNPKPVAFDGTATAFAGGGVPPASVTPSTALPTTGPGAPKFGQSTFGQSGFGQSKFGQSSFGQSSFGASKSAFAPPATYAVSPVPTSGGGFGAFAGSSTSFASLANQTADKNKPAYVEPVNSTDGEAGTLSKDSKPVFGLVKEAPSTEVKKGLTAGKSPFGSNAAVSKIGFGGPLRAKTGNEDDEEEDGEKKLKERFPEDEADKLEPEQIFTGPGLFESGGSSKSKPGDNAAKGLGRLGLSSGTEEKGKGAQRIESAFQAVPPLSAAIQHKTLAKKDQDQDSENEVSVELEDDVNEFLSEDDDYDDDLEEVDLTGDLEVHEFDDAEEVEEDDEEEDDEEEEEEEDDEEETASLPDDESDEATPPASKTGSSNKPQPKTVTPSVGSTAAGNVYNPFGRPVGTSKSQSENTKDDIPRSQASQSPLTPSRGSIHTPTKAADNSVASTSTTPLPLPRPSSADQLAPPTLQESPTRPKARPASPKAAFGSWGSSTATTQALPVPTGANSSIPTTLPDNKPQGQVTLGKSASPVANSLVNIATPSIVTPSEPQVRAIQPQHPELQNHLDQILINYGVLINSVGF
jgi:nucleoporin NUP159